MTPLIYVQDCRRAGLIGFFVSSVIVFSLLYYFALNYTAMTTCPPNPPPGGCTNSSAGFFQIVLVLLIFPASLGWNFFRGKRFEFYEDSINIIGRMGMTLIVPYSELFLGPLVQNGRAKIFRVTWASGNHITRWNMRDKKFLA